MNGNHGTTLHPLFNVVCISQFASSHFSSTSHLSDHVEKANTARKTRRRRTSGCEIETNKEFGIEDCRLFSNSAEFEYISRQGKLAAKCSSLDFVGTGKPVVRDSNENTASGSQVWHSDVNPSSRGGRNDNESHWYRIVSPQNDNIPELRWPP